MTFLWAITLWMCFFDANAVGEGHKNNCPEMWITWIMLPVGLVSMFRSSFLSLTFAVFMISAGKRKTSKKSTQLRTPMVPANKRKIYRA